VAEDEKTGGHAEFVTPASQQSLISSEGVWEHESEHYNRYPHNLAPVKPEITWVILELESWPQVETQKAVSSLQDSDGVAEPE
jgi:hypothetical protein